MVTPAKGLWHCMGACQIGGRAIDWVMAAQGVSFRHAVELLRAGETPTMTGTARSHRPALPGPVEAEAGDAEALAQVVAYYHATLTDSPEALAYLARRKIDDPEADRAVLPGLGQPDLGAAPPGQEPQSRRPAPGSPPASVSSGRRATSTWPVRSSSR